MGYGGSQRNLVGYVYSAPPSKLDPTGLVPIICECRGGRTLGRPRIEINCPGLATTCCATACVSRGGPTGNWWIKGASPDGPMQTCIGAAVGAAGCVQRCVDQAEQRVVSAVVGTSCLSGYTYAFGTVPNAGRACSPFREVSRISIWATQAKPCCRGLSESLLAERNAVQCLRRSLTSAGLPQSIGAGISVTARALGRACEIMIIVEAPIYAWCSRQCMRGIRY